MPRPGRLLRLALAVTLTALAGGCRTAPEPALVWTVGFWGTTRSLANVDPATDTLGNRMFDRIRQQGVGDNARMYYQMQHFQAAADLLATLDADADHVVTRAEAARLRLRLFGYSWGGTSALDVAWMLRQENVELPLGETTRRYRLEAPVAVDLVLVIDPVAVTRPLQPPGDNVRRFVNFYQTRGGDGLLRDAEGQVLARVGTLVSRRIRGVGVQRAQPRPADRVEHVTRNTAWRERRALGNGRYLAGSDCNHDTVTWLVLDEAARILRGKRKASDE